MSTANLFNSRVYIPRRTGSRVIAPARIGGLARERRTILYHPLPGAFGTGCLQKAEPRTLTDMTFLKFAAIYVSPVPLFLFYSPFSCFLFPVAATLAATPPPPLPRSSFPPASGSTVVSLSFPSLLFYFFFPLFFLHSTSRFPHSFCFTPSLPPQRGVHRLVSTSREGGEDEG